MGTVLWHDVILDSFKMKKSDRDSIQDQKYETQFFLMKICILSVIEDYAYLKKYST